jgi:hypothetical protein
MIPNNLILPTPQKTEFRPPYDDDYAPLTQRVLGGTAIGNGANGREVQRWDVFYEGGVIKVAPEAGAVEFTLTVAGVLTVSLAFDSNMQVTLGYTKADGSYLYFFNSLTSSFQTDFYPGSTSCRVVTDDPRNVTSDASDVIFTYELDGNVYYRIQRERYVTARLVGPSQGLTILRFAPNAVNRLQWELGTYRPPL